METQNKTPESNEPIPHIPAVSSRVRWERYLLFVVLPILVVVGVAVAYVSSRSGERTVSNTNGSVVLEGDPNYLQGGNQVQQPEPIPSDAVTERGPTVWVSVAWTNPWKKITVECVKDEYGYCDQSERYQIGKITAGEYTNEAVYVLEEYAMGGPYYRYYVNPNGKDIYFDEANIQIRGIDDLPEYIDLPGTKQRLERTSTSQAVFADEEKTRKMFTHPVLGDVYFSTASGGCFLALLPNGLAVAYSMEVPFVNKATGIEEISFEDGTVNKDAYNYIRPTCGGLCRWLMVVEEEDLKPEERLTVVGTANGGELIYGLRDPNDQALKDIYNDKNTVAYYDSSFDPQRNNKYTYQQFLAFRPLLYWQDGVGRWIEFRNQRIAVAAEMCKPVIYLYPTKPTNLSIYVAPNGGLTKTIPEYGNGWKVTAHRDGKIIDRKTGATHDYLFWEGIGMQYPQPQDGFVVPVAEVDSFFTVTLPKLGLTGREISDFKEYWVARLQNTGKPYALIHFMDPKDFTALAPIRIEGEQPDSLIRVMMTAKALDSKVSIPLQKLPETPQRNGFVFAEWGGALIQ